MNTGMTSTQKKRVGTPGKTRTPPSPPAKKATEPSCTFEELSQRATTETAVIHRILSFPLRGVNRP
jgi:hypothetical protein